MEHSLHYLIRDKKLKDVDVDDTKQFNNNVRPQLNAGQHKTVQACGRSVHMYKSLKYNLLLNRTMRTVSGTLVATPLPWLPVLCNVVPS